MSEANKLLRRVLEALREGFRPIIKIELTEEIRTYLANQETAKDEPVAFCDLTLDGKKISYCDGKPMIMTGNIGNECFPHPLYLHPKEHKKPMTHKEILAGVSLEAPDDFHMGFVFGARYAEKHHGIGEEK